MANFTGKLGNFQDSFETRKRLFINAFSICMTLPLSKYKWKTRYDHQKNIESKVHTINKYLT